MALSFFDPQIAESVGVNAAVIFQNIAFWCEKNAANDKHIHDGRAWTYNSNQAFAKMFPYLTESQIRTALDKLIEAGLIEAGNFNETAYDRTKWYCVKSQIHLRNFANGTEKNPGPIPDKNPDKNQIKIPGDEPDLFSANLSTPDQVDTALEIYNEAASRVGWPKCQVKSDRRISAIRARMKSVGGLEGWRVFVEKAAKAPHLIGKSRAGWFASLDWLTNPTNFAKVMEGNYDQHAPRNSGSQTTLDAFAAEAARWTGSPQPA